MYKVTNVTPVNGMDHNLTMFKIVILPKWHVWEWKYCDKFVYKMVN